MMSDFFSMGGYAGFIWPSWCIGFGVILAITIISLRQSARIKSALMKIETDGKNNNG